MRGTSAISPSYTPSQDHPRFLSFHAELKYWWEGLTRRSSVEMVIIYSGYMHHRYISMVRKYKELNSPRYWTVDELLCHSSTCEIDAINKGDPVTCWRIRQKKMHYCEFEPRTHDIYDHWLQHCYPLHYTVDNETQHPRDTSSFEEVNWVCNLKLNLSLLTLK